MWRWFLHAMAIAGRKQEGPAIGKAAGSSYLSAFIKTMFNCRFYVAFTYTVGDFIFIERAEKPFGDFYR